MTSPATDQVAATLASYQFATQSLRTSLTAYLTALWQSLGTYSNAQMATFIAQAVPVVNGGQQQMASLTAGYLAAQKAAALGVPMVPIAINQRAVTGAAVRNGTKPSEVYGRPFHLVWRQLADLPREPGSIDQAIQSGQDRVVQSALTDLQLSKRAAIDQVQAKDKQVRWAQRVIEGAHTCALCIVASTQRYHNGDLKGIHPGCDCSWIFVYGDAYPDQVVDPKRLHDVHALIEDRFGVSAAAARAIPSQGLPNYKDVLVTHEHGELGAVLAVRGAPFASADDYDIPKVVPQDLN